MRWKVILQASGHICALAGPDAARRPAKEERLLWEGEAWDSGEAIRKAAAADPRIDPVALRLRERR